MNEKGIQSIKKYIKIELKYKIKMSHVYIFLSTNT